MMRRVRLRSIVSAVILSLLTTTAAYGLDYSGCGSEIINTYAHNPSEIVLLNQNGKPTSNRSVAWGIEYTQCKKTCRAQVNRQSYTWDFLSQGLCGWFLPWLALAAQLPFQTKDRLSALTAFFLALGSPMLICFSLALTILNSRTINRKFRQLKDYCPGQGALTNTLNAARVILIDCQHVPIQIVNGLQRELPQLIIRPENWVWWRDLQREIQLTKRRWTYPLFAQLAFVCVFQILAIIAFFTVRSSNTSIGMGLAINSLWVWMFPVVLGWVYIGIQTSAGSIRAAIMKTTVPIFGKATNIKGRCVGVRDRTTFDSSRFIMPSAGRQVGILPKSSDDARHQRLPSDATLIENAHVEGTHIVSSLEETGSVNTGQYLPGGSFGDDIPKTINCETFELGPLTSFDLEQQASPHREATSQQYSVSDTFLSFTIAGHELETGSIYNYARIHSHMNAVQHVTQAFGQLIAKQTGHVTVSGRSWEDAPADWQRNLEGTPEELSRYVFPNATDNYDLSVHAPASSSVAINTVVAAIVATLLQWGSTGPAIMIAYK